MDSLRWRRHRHLLALIAAAFVILVVVFGDVRIAAITSSERGAAEAQLTQDIAGTVDLFDDSVVHEIDVAFSRAEYDDLIKTYQNEGGKAFIEATVTIDGTTIPSVGLRLKGNSTLMSLRRDNPFGGEGRERMRPPSECVPAALADVMPQAGATPAAGAGNPFGENVSADDPASLPWSLSFDEFVDGRRYQGLSDIAVRPVMTQQTMLNEALALKMVGAAGEPTQRAAYASFSTNDSEAQLRLTLEVPGDTFAKRNFDSDGVLYKALSTGSFDYLGDDPTLYETAFDQETAKNHQDLKPLVDLLKWVAAASDEELAAELDQHVDVASLARYIALQEMLDNFDDMAGPGKNYYLWYDLESKKFTVLTWDLNLALTDFGGPGGPGGRGLGEMDTGDFDAMFSCIERVRGEEEEQDRGGPGGMRMGHPLKDRFLALPEFQELYAEEYAAAYAALYGDGQAVAELDRQAAVAEGSGMLEPTTVEREAAALRTKLEAQATAGPIPDDSTNAATATPIAEPRGSAALQVD